MNPEEIYLQELGTIDGVAAYVARRHHLPASDTEEFVQEVRVRLLDNDYAILRKFQGRSTLRTYLVTVVDHLFSQCRVEQWGKWRPSAEAKRLGPKAITLERLLSQGLTWPEALRKLTTGQSAYTVRELEMIYLRLPHRRPRPVEVSEEVLPDVPVEAEAHQRMEASDRVRLLRKAEQLIDEFISRRMDVEDRMILQMRFRHARKVPDIARVLHLDQKKLYKRFDRLFAELRRALESAGVSQADVAALLDAGDEEIHLNLFSDGEIDPPGPSHDSGGDEVTRGKGGKKK